MTIIKRGKRFGVRLERGGTREWIGTFDTRQEAKVAEAEALLASPTDVTKLSISELAALYHEQHTAHKEASTRKNYRRATKAFQQFAHDKRASAVTYIDAQAFANEAARSTVDAVSTMYEWARRARILTDNPFDGVTRRGVSRPVEVVVLSDKQVNDLAGVALRELDTPMAEDMAAMILFAAGTGMRPAEIFALTWGDIDEKNDRVNVAKSVDADGNIKAPKNGKPRKVALLSLARDGLSLIARRDDEELVFTSNNGQRLSKSKLAYRWHTVRREAGHKSMRFYDLRHTCATRLLELGAYSFEVAEQLGHQDGGRLVERTYGHPRARQALERISELDAVAEQEAADANTVARAVAGGQ